MFKPNITETCDLYNDNSNNRQQEAKCATVASLTEQQFVHKLSITVIRYRHLSFLHWFVDWLV